jgi:asparagine synthase (glutamine-hydrolysing)
MCGILGVHGPKAQLVIERFQNALQLLLHRGPDAQKIGNFENCLLGHTRLKIIDIEDRSNQPMSAERGGLHITFNGEIYNFKALKRILHQKGYLFRTESDTEVLLAGYDYWGHELPNQLEGMFAFAIFNDIDKSLFLCRDPLGKKPLVFAHSDGVFLFASEIRPLSFLLKGNVTINLEAQNQFLALGYLLHPLTPYNEIQQLSPGHSLLVKADHTLTFRRYFSLPELFREKEKRTWKAAVSECRHWVEKAVERRLLGDVPHGLFLSGGLDSSILAQIIGQLTKEPMPAFAFSFKPRKYDEFSFAAIAAKQANLSLRKVTEPSDIGNLLLQFIADSDFIPADNAILPLYLLAKEAAREVKFVLTGDGADELFGGYATYRADAINQKLKHIQPVFHFLRALGLHRFLDFYNDKAGTLTKTARFLQGADKDGRKAHYQWRMIFSPEERVAMMGEDCRQLVFETDPYHRFAAFYEELPWLPAEEQHLVVDLQTWLTDDILVKTDRATMAAGLEARCPYLDISLLKFAGSLPIAFKRNKQLLREAFQDDLAPENISRNKTGFNSPIATWMNLDENEFKWFTKHIFEQKLI